MGSTTVLPAKRKAMRAGTSVGCRFTAYATPSRAHWPTPACPPKCARSSPGTRMRSLTVSTLTTSLKRSGRHLSEHSLSNTGPRKYYVVEFDFREKDKAGEDTEWAELVRSWASVGISVTDACGALLDHFSAFAPLGLVLHSAGKSC